MKLIIGGTCQGKKEYASEKYHLSGNDWTDGKKCGRDDVFHGKAVYRFHEYIRNRLREGEDTAALAEEILEKNPQLIIVTDEVGYGIVPVEKQERIWREACGRVCTRLAKEADSVIRVCCGIGNRIK